MFVDSNNRVRFTRDGIRFVVRENSIRAYNRRDGGEYAMTKPATGRAVLNNVRDIARASTLLTLNDIIDTV